MTAQTPEAARIAERLHDRLVEHEEMARMIAGICHCVEELAVITDTRQVLGEVWPGLAVVARRLADETVTTRTTIAALFSEQDPVLADLDAAERALVSDLAESIRKAPAGTHNYGSPEVGDV